MSPNSAAIPLARGIEPFQAGCGELACVSIQTAAAGRSESEILVLNGSREGPVLCGHHGVALCPPRQGPAGDPDAQSVLPGLWRRRPRGRLRAGLSADDAANGFLPDLDSLDDALLARTVAIFIASPANPQGSVASQEYFARLKHLADRFGFMILSDECYSEIYTRGAPGSALECAGPDYTPMWSRSSRCRNVRPARHARRLCRRRQEIPRRVS